MLGQTPRNHFFWLWLRQAVSLAQQPKKGNGLYNKFCPRTVDGKMKAMYINFHLEDPDFKFSAPLNDCSNGKQTRACPFSDMFSSKVYLSTYKVQM